MLVGQSTQTDRLVLSINLDRYLGMLVGQSTLTDIIRYAGRSVSLLGIRLVCCQADRLVCWLVSQPG